VRAQLRDGEARSVTALAGIKFTEMEPLYGDQYGQIAVSLNPATPGMRALDEILEGMREPVTQTPGRATISFLKISGGPPTAKPISVKVRADDRTELRAAADAVKAIVAQIPGARDVVDNDTPGRDELSLRVDVNAARNAGLDPGLVARLVRLHIDGEVVADLRDRGEKVELRVRAQPRTVARIQEKLAPRAMDARIVGFGGSRLLSIAGEIVQYVAEVKKPNEKRYEEYVDANLDSLRNELLSPAPVYDELEAATLADQLQLALDKLGPDHAFVKAALGGKTPAEAAKAAIAGTKLQDPAARRALLDGGELARARCDGDTSRRQTESSGRWASPRCATAWCRWRRRSSSSPSSRRTSSRAVTDSDRSAARRRPWRPSARRATGG